MTDTTYDSKAITPNTLTKYLEFLRRNKIKVLSLLILIGVIPAIGYFAFIWSSSWRSNNITYQGDFNILHIPTLIDSKDQNLDEPIIISIDKTEHQFVDGIKSKTTGYNGSFLGPTIKLYKDQDTRIIFQNNLDEATNIHGHGLLVPGDVDGGPQLSIAPNGAWDVILPIKQEASTSWYHPHLMHSTAHQVHSGLAGSYWIEDENSQSLNLPNTYGVNDIPIFIQDRTFIDGRIVDYPKPMPSEGLLEDTFVINGTLNPQLNVPQGLIRLRLVNGANARSFEIYMDGNAPFTKIATEGGFLNSPVEINHIRMTPGERNEIVVDTSGLSNGESLDVFGKFLPDGYNEFEARYAPRGRMLRLVVDESIKVEKEPELRAKLNDIEYYNANDVVQKRAFTLEGRVINNVSMNMTRIDQRVKLGDLERWTIRSGGHSFHVHGASFQILKMGNGEPPPPEEAGWKDTIYPRGKAEVLIKFDYEATDEYPYMFHCHILEHEDMGMMGQFTVQE